jgi:hypothetical protein
MEPTYIKFNAVSFNVSNAQELASALCAERKTLANRLLTSTDSKTLEFGNKILKSNRYIDLKSQLTADEINLINDYAELEYSEFSKRLIHKLVDIYDPGVICLQEVNTRSFKEQEAMLRTLKNRSFEVITKGKIGAKGKIQETGDCVIAFSKNKFTLGNVPFITAANCMDPGALCLDLISNDSHARIRVASDHVQGFNTKKYLETKDSNDVSGGDTNLETNLTRVVAVGEMEETEIGTFELDEAPDAYIYCLDANATMHHGMHFWHNQVHTKRLEIFEELGFSADLNDHSPTVIDASTGNPYRYDYIFAKNASICNAKITISDADQNPVSLSGTAGLNYMNLYMSDHLPVLTEVVVRAPDQTQ